MSQPEDESYYEEEESELESDSGSEDPDIRDAQIRESYKDTPRKPNKDVK